MESNASSEGLFTMRLATLFLIVSVTWGGCESFTSAPYLEDTRAYVSTEHLAPGNYTVLDLTHPAHLVIDVDGEPGIV
jgi:hypothetical protein